MLYVIAYDVKDDAKRDRLATALLDWGERIQYSVFEVHAEPSELPKLMARARAHIDEDDTLRIYPVCSACAEKVVCIGVQPEKAEEGGFVV